MTKLSSQLRRNVIQLHVHNTECHYLSIRITDTPISEAHDNLSMALN